MITRLKISGFKNLVDVDVHLGPFTCIAGPNAVGKSNLFDAIRFLSLTASHTLLESAAHVRNEDARNGDVRGLFHRVAATTNDLMRFEVEMIVPRNARDDLGQPARATANFLRYTLELRYRGEQSNEEYGRSPIEILKEELVHIPISSQAACLPFGAGTAWRKSAIETKHRSAPFISTKVEGATRVISLHQDGGSRGRAVKNPASQPRTVLSVVNADEGPTAVCAKRELESWVQLQLEPAALRDSDSIHAPFHLTAAGRHLPATLYRLAHMGIGDANEVAAEATRDAVYARVTNRLKDLIEDVAAVTVDRDEKRELLTLQVTGRDQTTHSARALSDGTLRFLALTVMELDPTTQGVVCIEEPENGISPLRIPAMLELLRDIATDETEPVDSDNPLRQVIINTHAPAVVLVVPDTSLLMAETREAVQGHVRFNKVVFSHLGDTWRDRCDGQSQIVSKGSMLAYLNPVPRADDGLDAFYARIGRAHVSSPRRGEHRVVDRDDIQPLLLHVAESQR